MSQTPSQRQYINHNSSGELLPIQGKADALIQDGATEISETVASALPPGQLATLVVVAENKRFDAALHVADSDTRTFVFLSRAQGDDRKLRWLQYEHASALAGRDYLEQHIAAGRPLV